MTLFINASSVYLFGGLPQGKRKEKITCNLPRARPSWHVTVRPIISVFALLLLVALLGIPYSALLVALILIIRRIRAKHSQIAAFGVFAASTAVVLVILGVILLFVFVNGFGALSVDFITQSPRNLGRAGGIFPAIVGTLYLVAGAIALALPIGVGAAVYLTEYNREGLATRIIRTGADLLNSTPSIVFGLFGFAFLVLYLGFGVSLLAGQITLALMVLPTIIRTTEEALKTVPNSLREGSLALGATKWQTIRRVVIPPAIPGILTGAILSIGRAAGETAPIMFTAVVFSQRFLPTSLQDPVMALPYHLFILSTNVAGADQNKYGTAMVLVLLVSCIYMAAILIRNRSSRGLR